MNSDVTDALSLSARARQLLKVLVETHISEGTPVGSRTLSRVAGLDVSPATIRNVMSDLEDLGLIASPHTSAGRIPTSAGYRIFVDSMLQTKPLDLEHVRNLENSLGNSGSYQSMAENASVLLSNITHMAGVVTLPKRDLATLQQIEFVPLEGNRVLAVLVLSHGEVQNRVLCLDKAYSRSDLQHAANYLTEQYAGLDFTRARQRLLLELEELRRDMNSMMEAAIALGQEALAKDEGDDFVLRGETQLMDYSELSDIERLRVLFESFGQKQDILHLLDRCANADGVQIFIGQESGNRALNDCSLVTAPYSVDGSIVGVLGVIGPTRMAYDKVIPIVDVTAKLLGAALNSR